MKMKGERNNGEALFSKASEELINNELNITYYGFKGTMVES